MRKVAGFGSLPVMQVGRKNALVQLVAKPAMAGFLAVLILFVSTAAVSPALHQWLHANANSPDHSCVITTLAKGHVNAAVGPLIIVSIVAAFFGLTLLSETFTLPSADYRFSSSRAPPVLSLLPIR